MKILFWLHKIFIGAAYAEAAEQVPTKAPHERWPEILHWCEGDEFETGCPAFMDKLVRIRPDGCAITKDKYDGDLHVYHLSRLIGHNQSLRNRNITAELTEREEYMDLLREFNRAVKELEERDRRNGIKAA